jgi:phage/plasmid-associated DNA primase/ssDNA-binding Zn-finger/Zn-ribbon topoisomerase 1
MQSIASLKFDIRKFVDVLTQAKKNYWICPACNKPKLTIDKAKGKYQCWSCYDTEKIARILIEPQREEKRRREESERIVTSKSPRERIAEWVEESGVSESIAVANLRHIEDSVLIAQLLNWNWYSGSPGWYVFGCDPITGMRTKRGQFKPDTPLKRPDEQSSQKYITFPKGGKENNRLAAVYLILAMADWQRISEKWGIPIEESDIDNSRDDLGFWKWVLNHPEIPIVVSEGIKKEGCLLSLGWVAISVTGVWNGQTGKGKKLHKDLAPFIVPGRRVYFAFDADLLVNESVEGALRQLGHLIKREKAEVFVCQWSLDAGKGIDDFIVGGGDFQPVIDEAISYSEWLKSLQGDGSGNGSGSGSGGDSGGGGSGDGSDGDQHRPDPNDKHPEAFYRPFCEALKLPFENCVTAGTFDNWAYRTEFGAADGDWRVIDAAFYRWIESLGYWEHQPDNRINTMIADCGDKAFKLKNSKEFGWQVGYPYGTNSHKESAFKYCRSRLERPEPLPTNTHLRAFKNCTVDLRTGARMPHDKGYYLTSIIPYEYEPGRECPEIFRQFIADSFGEDMLPIIRAFTSMFLDPTAPYGRFPHLIGKSGGGKGTMGRFWNSLFGEDGASSGDFSNLSTAEGRHQYLTGKQIFSVPDSGGYVSGLRAFYELVDNGGMSGRALFNPVGYFKTWNIRFWIASVDHLQIENAGDGWARRAYPIPVRARTVRPDPDLRLKLEACKADVISWALAMPREERDRILLSPPTNERVINLTMDSALYGDSTKSFVDLCLRPSSDAGFIPHHLLHTWYVAYCKEHGYTPLGMSKFISHLKTILPQNFSDRSWSPMVDGKRSRVAAHWEFISPLEGAFVKSDVEVDNNPFQGRTEKNNPTWICIKSACEEGGLMDFEDFWQPPQPPQPPLSYCDNTVTDTKDYMQPIPSQNPPEFVQSVQGGSNFAESLKQRNSGGVQGGSTVQGIASAIEKNAVCVVEKLEVENTNDFSSTSVTGGGQTECTLDSFNPCHQTANDGEISDASQVGQVTTVQPEVAQCETEDIDIWMTEENLASIAFDLNECPDRETLALLHECWSGRAMNAASKRLSPEKHAQIKQWVFSLNNAKEEELIEPIQAELFTGAREQAHQITPGDWSWE